jgi:hypothetical protein
VKNDVIDALVRSISAAVGVCGNHYGLLGASRGRNVEVARVAGHGLNRDPVSGRLGALRSHDPDTAPPLVRNELPDGIGANARRGFRSEQGHGAAPYPPPLTMAVAWLVELCGATSYGC